MIAAHQLYKVAGGGWRQGNIMPAAQFTFDGVHVFLTYPQCPLEREQLRDFFLSLEGSSKYFIARELHSDGAYHLHAYVNFGRRRRFTTSSCFDVDGYHPNIQRPRSAKHVLAYCSKSDSEPLANFELGELDGSGRDSVWGEILASCTTPSEFLGRVRSSFPRHYILDHERLVAFCERHFRPDPEPYSGRTRDEFRELSAMSDWVDANLLQVRFGTYGPSGGAPVPSPHPLKAIGYDLCSL